MRKAQGFTIVELLVVIIVIAILATISVVTYGNIRDQARVTSFRSQVVQVRKKVELERITNGKYPFEDEVRTVLIANGPNAQQSAHQTIFNFFVVELEKEGQIAMSYVFNSCALSFSCPAINTSGELEWTFFIGAHDDQANDMGWFITGSRSATVYQAPKLYNPGGFDWSKVR